MVDMMAICAADLRRTADHQARVIAGLRAELHHEHAMLAQWRTFGRFALDDHEHELRGRVRNDVPRLLDGEILYGDVVVG